MRRPRDQEKVLIVSPKLHLLDGVMQSKNDEKSEIQEEKKTVVKFLDEHGASSTNSPEAIKLQHLAQRRRSNRLYPDLDYTILTYRQKEVMESWREASERIDRIRRGQRRDEKYTKLIALKKQQEVEDFMHSEMNSLSAVVYGHAGVVSNTPPGVVSDTPSKEVLNQLNQVSSHVSLLAP